VTFDQRIAQAGYRRSGAADNIAKDQPDPASVVAAWMNSPGHRTNILDFGYRDIGVGLAYDANHTPLWTRDFARRCQRSARSNGLYASACRRLSSHTRIE
jgi:uncharacterized protein YkwD